MFEHTITQMIITVVASVLASSGFWAIIQRAMDKKSKQSKMLVGLAHDRIVYLSLTYIDRGWIRHSEYENLIEWLYEPYANLGGNGSVSRLVEEVKLLKIIDNTHVFKEDEK